MREKELLSEEFVLQCLPVREQETHKGNYGSVFLVAGSRRYRGAAALATEGALRTGAGLVTLATVEEVIQGILPRLPECCFVSCRANEEGGISAGECGRLLPYADRSKVLMMGSGLGNTADSRLLVKTLLSQRKGAAVLDADGLNVVAAALREGMPLPHPAEGFPLIITPHSGEMSRLTGLSVSQVNGAREQIALSFAEEHNCIVVLKGHRTLIAAPDGRLYENTTGNAGLARGGSGDILAGMIAGLLACGLSAVDAAACGVWLHGKAADLTAQRRGQYGMLPHDLFEDLGSFFARHNR